ncbi:hypothetical protein [Phenylobacterium koreense]|uniref:Uncharacterized protein n=1 Tax=Phenylobacterium koreense TaxID=266125 RepID=A0ABV2EJM4_9CAUL
MSLNHQATSAVGFMVWCPERGMPSYVHDTFAAALAEAERLKRANRGHRFFVMAPVTNAGSVAYASAVSIGLTAGREEAHADVVNADARADRARDEAHELRIALDRLQPFADNAEDFQAIVADCQCWFDGFAGAQSGRESYERSHLPSRDKLTALNAAFQAVLRARPVRTGRDEFDDHIPF